MKVCYKCKNSHEGSHSYCKECRKQVDKDYHQRRDKVKKYAQNEIRKDIIREWLKLYLTEHPCSCGESRLPTLQFHHLKDKKFNIADAVRFSMSLEKLKFEVEKCQVLCANCHAIVTSKERNHYKSR